MPTHPWLAPGDPSLVPVHQRGDGGVPSGLLQVALAEHLLLQGRNPLPVNAVLTGQVAQVGTFECNLNIKPPTE